MLNVKNIRTIKQLIQHNPEFTDDAVQVIQEPNVVIQLHQDNSEQIHSLVSQIHSQTNEITNPPNSLLQPE